MLDDFESDDLSLEDFEAESEFLEDYELEASVEIVTKCHACFGTGMDKYVDADCLICYGDGVI